ncbi:hypothetical protein Lal_00041418 [Lupinus albus]|nr:hypothetical protein Lal_00041418 [Lupinus albus]
MFAFACELCRKNKEILKKQVIPHTGGSKPNSRRRREMANDDASMSDTPLGARGSYGASNI